MKEDHTTQGRSAPAHAMTGAHGPALRGRDADRTIPFFDTDATIPYRLSVEAGADHGDVDPRGLVP